MLSMRSVMNRLDRTLMSGVGYVRHCKSVDPL